MSKNVIQFDSIAKTLEEKGITVDLKTLQKLETQGLMSTVYEVGSNKGELIIHIIDPLPEWERQKIWEKIRGVGDLLLKYKGLPTAPVYASGELPDGYFIVQKKLRGMPAGGRSLIKNKVSDLWTNGNANVLVPKIQKLVAESHSIRGRGFGPISIRNGKLEGIYGSWEEFFKKELPRMLGNIKKADAGTRNPEALKPSLNQASDYVKKFLTNVPKTKSYLIHGDAINPSNILVVGNTITGLVDWEWSLFGDPAWEFCDPSWWQYLDEKSLKPYFTKAGITSPREQARFIKRVHRYIPIWLVWGCNLHASKPNGKLYKLLRHLLTESLLK